MYSDSYLRGLRKANTESLVSPLDDTEVDTAVGQTKPTYNTPILSTEDTYQEVLGPKRAENNIKLAELAKDVYQQPDNRLSEWDDYQYKTKYSNKYMSTYTKDGNIIFALRGTKDLEDMGLDLETPSGLLLNERFKKLLGIVNNAIKEFKSEYGEVTFTGHSLGGLLSQMMGKSILDSRGVTFNAATAPWLEQGETRRVKNYRILGDPISKSKTFGKQINLRPKVPTAQMTKQYKGDQPNIKLLHSIDQLVDRKLLEDDPNIYIKERFSYYSQVVQNLVALGFSALLTSKLYPLLGRYIFPISAEDARQQAITRGIRATAGSVYSTPEQMARIYSEYMSPQRVRIRAQEEQVDLATNASNNNN